MKKKEKSMEYQHFTTTYMDKVKMDRKNLKIYFLKCKKAREKN